MSLLQLLGLPSEVKVFLSPWAAERGGQYPSRSFWSDAGFDLHYAGDEVIVIPPQGVAKIPTGLHIDIPELPAEHCLQVHFRITSRTGLGIEGTGPAAVNVDAGYRPGNKTKEYFNLGLVLAIRDHSDKPLTFKPGDKVAQGIFALSYTPTLKAVEFQEIHSDTERSASRFHSTGHNPGKY